MPDIKINIIKIESRQDIVKQIITRLIQLIHTANSNYITAAEKEIIDHLLYTVNTNKDHKDYADLLAEIDIYCDFLNY